MRLPNIFLRVIENNVKIKQYISVDISFIFRKTIGITYSILFTFNIAFHIFPLLKLSSGRIIVFSRWKPSDFLNYTVVWKSRPEPWFFDHGLHASCHTSHHSGGSTSQIRKKKTDELIIKLTRTLMMVLRSFSEDTAILKWPHIFDQLANGNSVTRWQQ